MADDALYQIGLTHLNEGKSEEALKKFEEVISKFPESELKSSVFRKMAALKKASRDYDSAVLYLRKALTGEKNELNAQAQYEIAEYLEEKGDIEGALEEYLKVPYLYSKSDSFWAVRAQLKSALAFERLNRIEEAKRIYEKLVSLNVEESEFAKKRLEWLKWKRED